MSETGQNFSSMGNLSIGSSGTDVRNMQLSINNRPPSALPPLDPDGYFGNKTDARVREFQKNNGLVIDGIVGPQTRAALISGEPKPPEYGCNCCNPENYSTTDTTMFADYFRYNRNEAGAQVGFARSGSSGVSAPLRMLDDVQKVTAMPVFGASLDFSTIFISNKRGLGGRPFTIAFNDSGQIVQIMNCGTFTPSRATLIHELAHVWQSQHHSNKYRFMANAIDSQAGAIVASTAAAISDPLVALNKDFPTFYPFDAYAYDPGLPFANMAAEQMAKAIENGESAIVSRIKSIGMNTIDPSCEAALSRPGFADRRLPGVK